MFTASRIIVVSEICVFVIASCGSWIPLSADGNMWDDSSRRTIAESMKEMSNRNVTHEKTFGLESFRGGDVVCTLLWLRD